MKSAVGSIFAGHTNRGTAIASYPGSSLNDCAVILSFVWPVFDRRCPAQIHSAGIVAIHAFGYLSFVGVPNKLLTVVFSINMP
jgi:hypothetical protein